MNASGVIYPLRVVYRRRCRDCEAWYTLTTVKPSGSKWTSLCGSWLYWEF